MDSNRKCSDCGTEMEAITQRREVFQPDPETMTDGQLAEQIAAGMGGAFEEGIHGRTFTVYACEECEKWVEVST